MNTSRQTTTNRLNALKNYKNKLETQMKSIEKKDPLKNKVSKAINNIQTVIIGAEKSVTNNGRVPWYSPTLRKMLESIDNIQPRNTFLSKLLTKKSNHVPIPQTLYNLSKVLYNRETPPQKNKNNYYREDQYHLL